MGHRRFDHVLLTRFSAVMAPGAPAPDEAWLRYRLGFFYDACLPSVLSQRDADFDWLVLLDDRCSDAFRADVEGLADGAFTPVWTHEPFRRDSFAGPVAARSHAPYLISTRIDSDDAMAVDLMAAVQARFAGQERLFVNFPRGVQIDRAGAVYRTDIASSPFLSLIERREPGRPPATVYVAKHARARAHGPLLQVRAPVMWAQVVHDDNVSNIVNGRQTDPRVVRQRFEMDLGYDAQLAGARLHRAQVRQGARLLRLWAQHPGELTKRVEASAVTARGTRVWPQSSGETLSDRVESMTRSVRTGARDLRWRAREWAGARGPSGVEVLAGDLAGLLTSDRVVLLAEWSGGREVRRDALRAAGAWAAAGWPTLVLAAREPWVRPRRPALPEGVVLARRRNTAYDFGAWRDALATWPDLARTEQVVLTNDSLVGPVAPLGPLLDRLTSSTATVWAATAATRPVDHLQSYLLAFRGGVLAAEPLRGFFASVRPEPSKSAVVHTYELGLSRVLRQHGISTEVGWRQADLDLPAHADVTLQGWEALLDAGFPFVKRTLLASPRYAGSRPAVRRRLDGAAG